jgi:hypothetical protein
MTIRTYTKDQAITASMGDQSLIRIQWTGLLNGDTGQPVPWGEWADRTFSVWCQNYATGASSTIGVGGQLTIEGCNDYDPVTNSAGGTWVTLTDQQGSLMAFSAAALKQGSEAPLWVRPHVTNGDGTTSATVVMAARRFQPMIAH